MPRVFDSTTNLIQTPEAAHLDSKQSLDFAYQVTDLGHSADQVQDYELGSLAPLGPEAGNADLA